LCMWMSLGARLVEAAELEIPFPENLDTVFLASEGSVTMITLYGMVITSAIRRAVLGHDTHSQGITIDPSHPMPLTELTMTIATPALLRSTLQRYTSLSRFVTLTVTTLSDVLSDGMIDLIMPLNLSRPQGSKAFIPHSDMLRVHPVIGLVLKETLPSLHQHRGPHTMIMIRDILNLLPENHRSIVEISDDTTTKFWCFATFQKREDTEDCLMYTSLVKSGERELQVHRDF
jgi:hypothetical protein